ncbi:hypothetical protein G9A89_010588 [Geosiphon pyriformis]|nr:hypothetical protein G9A89_010588 [Geosiphon pyriformis]
MVGQEFLDMVSCGRFSKIVSGGPRKTVRKVLFWAHYQFHQCLIAKAEELGVRVIPLKLVARLEISTESEEFNSSHDPVNENDQHQLSPPPPYNEKVVPLKPIPTSTILLKSSKPSSPIQKTTLTSSEESSNSAEDSTTITTTTTTTTVRTTVTTTRISSQNIGKEKDSNNQLDVDNLTLETPITETEGQNLPSPTSLNTTTTKPLVDFPATNTHVLISSNSTPAATITSSSKEESPTSSISNHSSTTPTNAEILHSMENSNSRIQNFQRTESASSIPVVHVTTTDDETTSDGNVAAATSAITSTKSLSSLQNCDSRRSSSFINNSFTETPKQYLERMQDTLSKSELSTLLAKNKDVFHEAVFRTYMDSFAFHQDPIDIALRKFLMDCCLPKETQQIDRVMEAFARRYHECNPDIFPSEDTAYILAFSLLMLHTDAFNKSVKRKMTKREFVQNSRIDGVPSEILEILYDNVTFTQFIYAEDDTDVNGLKMLASPTEYRQSRLFGSSRERKPTSRPKNDPYYVIQNKTQTEFTPTLRNIVPLENPYSYKGTLPVMDTHYLHRAFINAHTIRITGVRARRNSGEPFHPTVSSDPSWEDDEKAGTFLLKITKAGRLSRKVDLVEGGKKATGFLRSWKEFGVILSGSQLMFFKDSSWFDNQMSEFLNTLNATKIPVLKPDVILMTADSVAVFDKSYKKYPHVFRLVGPKGQQYLFEASDEEQMNDWIIKINYAAAFRTAGVKMRHYNGDTVNHEKEKTRKNRRLFHQIYSQPQDNLILKDKSGRPDVLQSKIEGLGSKIATLTSQLNTDVRFIKNLTVMIPYRATTRDRIITVATEVGKRIKQTCLELTRLLCYHEIMEKDLCQSVMEEEDYWSKRRSTSKSGYDRKYRGKYHKREVLSEYDKNDKRNRQNTMTTNSTLGSATHSPDSSLTYSILLTPTQTPSDFDFIQPIDFDEFDGGNLNNNLYGVGTSNSAEKNKNDKQNNQEQKKLNVRDDASSFVEIGFEEGKDLENFSGIDLLHASSLTSTKISENELRINYLSLADEELNTLETRVQEPIENLIIVGQEKTEADDEKIEKREQEDLVQWVEEENDSGDEQFVDAEEGDLP